MSAPHTPTPSPDALESIAKRLEEGLGADIWYDAHTYGDEQAMAIIEATQSAMQEAVALVRALAAQELQR